MGKWWGEQSTLNRAGKDFSKPIPLSPQVQFSSFQSLSCVWLFVTPWTAARQVSLSITNSRSLPKLMSIESVMPYSAYKLNEQGDNIQPWHTPFPIWNHSVVLCPVLTVVSWPAYRFLKRQSGGLLFPSLFRIFYSLLWSTQSKALA